MESTGLDSCRHWHGAIGTLRRPPPTSSSHLCRWTDCSIDRSIGPLQKVYLPGLTGSNEVSVAEDEVMRILLLVRYFLPAHEEIAKGEVRSHVLHHAAARFQIKESASVSSWPAEPSY